jgi:stage III sporulation protein SpoIIIAA
MMVRRREEQAGVLVQAVQNHNPDVIIVDKIGTKAVSFLWELKVIEQFEQNHNPGVIIMYKIGTAKVMTSATTNILMPVASSFRQTIKVVSHPAAEAACCAVWR